MNSQNSVICWTDCSVTLLSSLCPTVKQINWCAIYISVLYLIQSVLDFLSNLHLKPVRLTPLEIFVYTFQPALQLKDLSAHMNNRLSCYTYIYTHTRTSVLTLVLNNIFHYTKKWHIWHEKIFLSSQNIHNIGWIFFCHIKVNGFSWNQEKGCLTMSQFS